MIHRRLLLLLCLAEGCSAFLTVPHLPSAGARPLAVRRREASSRHALLATAGEARRDAGLGGLPGPGGKGGETTGRYWEWQNGWRIHYETRLGSDKGPAVLLLSGFGVGGFHWHRNIDELAEAGLRVHTMDVLGQGSSWPSRDPAPGGGLVGKPGFEWGFGPKACEEQGAAELTYSCTLWRDQAIDFIEQVVGEPVVLAGNSLGGYLSAMIACERPDLVKGIFFINPTPWWGVGPQRLLPWDGGYPVPAWVRPFTVAWWDTLRKPSTIETLLSQVYADSARIGAELVKQIIEPTEQPAAASAFASILCSPGSALSFSDMLKRIDEEGKPAALVYGKEDPWIVPIWGHRAKRILSRAPYVELSPSGHCPHHETPEAINALLAEWAHGLLAEDSAAPKYFPAEGEEISIDSCVDGYLRKGITIRAYDASPRTFVERLDDALWRVLG